MTFASNAHDEVIHAAWAWSMFGMVLVSAIALTVIVYFQVRAKAKK